MARLGARLASLAPAQLFLLSGSLGSGKTVLVRGALRGLGYKGRVASPTFSLRNDYRIHRGPWRLVVHVDAYRLRHPREEAALELSWLLSRADVLVFIEWPERLRLLPAVPSARVRIQHHGRGRQVTVLLPTRSAAAAATPLSVGKQRYRPQPRRRRR